jgi:hypothetical protein
MTKRALLPLPDEDPSLQPNKDAIREFLQHFQKPAGWAIAALGETMITRYFMDLDAAVDEAFRVNLAGRSVYHVPGNFHAPADRTKNPKDSDISSSDYLWADIDPEGFGDVEQERECILRRVTTDLPQGVPEPTGIVCSGNGYQLYWKVEPPVLPDELAAKNKWLIDRLGADKTAFNPGRLLRVPGTVNWPTKTKEKKGRKPEPAYVVTWDHRRTYAPDAFPNAARTLKAGNRRAERAAPPARLSQFEFDNLPLSGELRALIVGGADPVDILRFKSRSDAVWHANREMVRAGLSDDTIYAIITDENFAISDHILSQQDIDRAARRNIARARLSVENPALEEMNAKHAVIGYVGGKCMVTVEVPSPGDPVVRLLQLQSLPEFRQAYASTYVETPNGPIAIGKWWLMQPQRRQYETLVFRPGEPEEIGNSLNLWHGFAVAPRVGDWSKLRLHIQEVLAGGEEQYAQYIMRWVAWMVQNPGKRAEVALVLKGGRGTGKGTFAGVLKTIFGRHALQVSSAKQVAGDFNAHLRSVVFLFSDESYFPGSKANEGTLKRLLTEDTLFIEAKGRDGEEVPNCLHVLMASNEDWVVPAGIDERRFAVFEVSSRRAQNEAYFSELNAELADGGVEAFLYDMLAMDIGDWHPRRVPQTLALLDQKLNSLTLIQEWIYGLLQEGRLPCSTAERPNFATNSNLYNRARHTNPRLRDVSDIKLGKALKDVGVTDGWSGKQKGKQFPPLAEMRADFEQRLGGKIEWGATNADGAWEADATGLEGVPF